MKKGFGTIASQKVAELLVEAGLGAAWNMQSARRRFFGQQHGGAVALTDISKKSGLILILLDS